MTGSSEEPLPGQGSEPPDGAAEAAAGAGAPAWTGHGLEPFEVGDPGRAAREVVPTLLTDPWGRPDTAVDGGAIGALTVRAASLRGRYGHYFGKTRQDEYGLGTDPAGRWLVAAVADGVTAGRLSHHAARITVRHGCRLLAGRLAERERLEEQDWNEVFADLARSILAFGGRELASDGEEPTPAEIAGAMASTATFAVCATSPELEYRPVTVAWIGDSPAWVLHPDGSWECLSEIKNEGEEVASSRTPGLPLLPADGIAVNPVEIGPGDTLLLMSDGVGDPLGDATGEVGRFLGQVWEEPPDPLTFAAQVGFARKSFDDDRTVVAVWTPRRAIG
jgi:serine/threonine protein phosphatase PrpC